MHRLLISTIFFTLFAVLPVSILAQGADTDPSTPFNESYFTTSPSTKLTLNAQRARYTDVTKTNFNRSGYLNCATSATDTIPGFAKSSDPSTPFPNMRPGGTLCDIFPIVADPFSVYKKEGSLIMITYYREDTGTTFYYNPNLKRLQSAAEVQSLAGNIPIYQYLDSLHGEEPAGSGTPPANQSAAPSTNTTADPATSTSTSGANPDASLTANDYVEFAKLPNPLGGAGINTTGDAIDKITTIVMIVAIPFVTIMIMYAGFSYIAAYGNPEKIRMANKRALWTLVGTLLLFGATTIGNAIIKTIQKITTEGIPSEPINNPNTSSTTPANTTTTSSTPSTTPVNTTTNVLPNTNTSTSSNTSSTGRARLIQDFTNAYSAATGDTSVLNNPQDFVNSYANLFASSNPSSNQNLATMISAIQTASQSKKLAHIEAPSGSSILYYYTASGATPIVVYFASEAECEQIQSREQANNATTTACATTTNSTNITDAEITTIIQMLPK